MKPPSITFHRLLIWALLVGFAAFFLVPLYVMFVTSVKDMSEIRSSGGLLALPIWQFTAIWNDFLFGVVFSGPDSKPIAVGLNNLANTSSAVKEYNVDMAAAMIAALPTLVVYLVAGKYFVRGLTAGAVKC